MGRSYDEFIAPGEFVFRSRADETQSGNDITFTWEMARRDNGLVVGVGREVFVLDETGRIRADFQFIVG